MSEVVIQIKANVDSQNIQVCRFTVDRPVHSGSAIFRNKEEAQNSGNSLAIKLFHLPSVAQVELDENIVMVTKDTQDEWQTLGRQIGKSIRSFLQPPPPGDRPPDDLIKEKIQQLIEIQINPGVASHGGFVELINVADNNVYLRMGGGCQGCGSANMTLKMGIERMIREEIPNLGEIIDVTDHQAGQNPYYNYK